MKPYEVDSGCQCKLKMVYLKISYRIITWKKL